MSWNDYEDIWKRQELPLGAAADLVDVKQSFETKRRKLERTIQLRNNIEGVGGVLASVILGLVTWWVGILTWPVVLGILLIACVSCVFLGDRKRFHGGRLGPEAPMLARLEANIAELRHQRALISNFGKWYVTPYLLAIALIGYGLGLGLSRHAGPEALLGLLTTLLTTPATLCWIIVLITVPTIALVWWWLDIQKTIRLRIEPRIVELEKLRHDLTSANE